MFVRVKSPDRGFEYTVTEEQAKADNLEVLKKDATDEFGRVLPALPITDKAGNPVAPKATTTKEA